MNVCPNCPIESQHYACSRIPDEIQAKCPSHRHGTCIACRRLTEIEQEIDDARRVLERLLAERKALAPMLNEHHDPFAQLLPVEIASHIFKFCKPQPSNLYPDVISTPSYHETELTNEIFSPGRVCQNWRRLSRDTSELWNVFSMTITESNFTTSFTYISEWLQRCLHLPLIVQLRVVRPYNDPDNQHFCEATRKAIIAIIQHAERWSILDLEIPSSFAPWISDALSDKKLQCLENLSIKMDMPGEEVLRLDASPVWLAKWESYLDQVSIDWTQLRRVCLDTSYIDEIIDLLESAPHLQTLKISEVRQHEDDTVPGSYMVTSALHTLTVDAFYPSFWSYFTFPSLETLIISYPYHPINGAATWTSLRDLLHRSGCKLQCLWVADHKFSRDIAQVFEHTPELKELCLEGRILGDPFFSMMDEAAARQQDPSQPSLDFLPSLESFRCITRQTNFEWTSLVAFLMTMTSRPSQSLRSFKFDYFVSLTDHTSIMDEKTFKNLMDVANTSLDFQVRGDARRAIKLLHQHYGF